LEEKKLRILMSVRHLVVWAGLLVMTSYALASPKALVFVSFSMPERLLIETLKDSARLSIPAVLNGLHHNSMLETAKKMEALSHEVPDLQMQIDPTAFERFDIHQVPAFVLEHKGCFDVIYGHLPLQEGLNRLMSHGACHVSNQMIKEARHA
jgi:conjugal transfer pilus assembly protein TrbC